MATPGATPRARLLDRAIGYLSEHGMGGLSLRDLATALGTSHRMLIYHFGSGEGLRVEVVRAVDRRHREMLTELLVSTDGDVVAVARELWHRLTDPSVAPHERLFFELYGQALQGRQYALPLLDGDVDAWVRPLATMLEGAGVPAVDARAQARLGLAVSRGLLLDLLATGDRAGTGEAFECYLTACVSGDRRSCHGYGEPGGSPGG